MMRSGQIGWHWLLLGLPWSFFVIRLIKPFAALDIWHANTLWAESWAIAIILLAFLQRTGTPWLPRAWVGLLAWTTLMICWDFAAKSLPKTPYPSALLMGIGHFWIISLVLATSLRFWTTDLSESLCRGLWWSSLLLCAYGLCQMANLDQFFRNLDPSVRTDALVGTIGNQTHFGCLLALLLPIHFLQSGWKRLSSLIVLGLIAATHSTTAIVAAGGIVIWTCWRSSWRWGLALAVSCSGLGLFFLLNHPVWASDSGRFATWEAWKPLFLEHPILGWGLGSVKQITQQLPTTHPLYLWRHLHNEYFQWIIETGLVGFGFLLWVMGDLIRRCVYTVWTPLRIACVQILVVFGLESALSFPVHLWQLGSVALVAYLTLLHGTEGMA